MASAHRRPVGLAPKEICPHAGIRSELSRICLECKTLQPVATGSEHRSALRNLDCCSSAIRSQKTNAPVIRPCNGPQRSLDKETHHADPSDGHRRLRSYASNHHAELRAIDASHRRHLRKLQFTTTE